MATQPLRYLSHQDGYLPQATGQVIAHIRKEDEYPINRYCQLAPSKTSNGVYPVLGRDQFVRVTNVNRFRWVDGDSRPDGIWNKVPYQWVNFHCERNTFPWQIGYEALKQTAEYGAFDPEIVHMRVALTQCMTERTIEAQTLLQTSANWPSTQVANAADLSGNLGGWVSASDDPSSPQYQTIFLTLTAAAQNIHLMTNGQVKPTDLVTIVSPVDARLIAKAPEIVNFMRESPAAREITDNGLDPQYALWGLPRQYKSFKFVVDDTVYVKSNPNTTTDSGPEGAVPEAALSASGRQYVWQSGSAVMASRVGGLDGLAGAPTFSTVQMYHHGGLAEVEAKDEYWDRLVKGAVTEERVFVIAAPFSGMYISGILG